jgi:hypothetical protein
MKKILLVVLCVVLAVGVVGCGAKEDENKTYDSDFIADITKGFEARWDYADGEALKETDEKAVLTKATSIELETVEKYKDLPFSDSVLKEKALSYINELNNGLTVISTYGADSFYQDWDAHYDSRTKLLVEINEIYPFSVDDKHKSQFEEMANRGLEVKESNEKETAANELLKQFQFNALEPEYEGTTYITYEATVENVTDFDFESFSVLIELIDGDGVVLETTYCSISNWNSGKKVKTEFISEAKFDSLEVNLDYFS